MPKEAPPLAQWSSPLKPGTAGAAGTGRMAAAGFQNLGLRPNFAGWSAQTTQIRDNLPPPVYRRGDNDRRSKGGGPLSVSEIEEQEVGGGGAARPGTVEGGDNRSSDHHKRPATVEGIVGVGGGGGGGTATGLDFSPLTGESATAAYANQLFHDDLFGKDVSLDFSEELFPSANDVESVFPAGAGHGFTTSLQDAGGGDEPSQFSTLGQSFSPSAVEPRSPVSRPRGGGPISPMREFVMPDPPGPSVQYVPPRSGGRGSRPGSPTGSVTFPPAGADRDQRVLVTSSTLETTIPSSATTMDGGPFSPNSASQNIMQRLIAEPQKEVSLISMGSERLIPKSMLLTEQGTSAPQRPTPASAKMWIPPTEHGKSFDEKRRAEEERVAVAKADKARAQRSGSAGSSPRVVGVRTKSPPPAPLEQKDSSGAADRAGTPGAPPTYIKTLELEPQASLRGPPAHPHQHPSRMKPGRQVGGRNQPKTVPTQNRPNTSLGLSHKPPNNKTPAVLATHSVPFPTKDVEAVVAGMAPPISYPTHPPNTAHGPRTAGGQSDRPTNIGELPGVLPSTTKPPFCHYESTTSSNWTKASITTKEGGGAAISSAGTAPAPLLHSSSRSPSSAAAAHPAIMQRTSPPAWAPAGTSGFVRTLTPSRVPHSDARLLRDATDDVNQLLRKHNVLKEPEKEVVDAARLDEQVKQFANSTIMQALLPEHVFKQRQAERNAMKDAEAVVGLPSQKPKVGGGRVDGRGVTPVEGAASSPNLRTVALEGGVVAGGAPPPNNLRMRGGAGVENGGLEPWRTGVGARRTAGAGSPPRRGGEGRMMSYRAGRRHSNPSLGLRPMTVGGSGGSSRSPSGAVGVVTMEGIGEVGTAVRTSSPTVARGGAAPNDHGCTVTGGGAALRPSTSLEGVKRLKQQNLELPPEFQDIMARPGTSGAGGVGGRHLVQGSASAGGRLFWSSSMMWMFLTRRVF